MENVFLNRDVDGRLCSIETDIAKVTLTNAIKYVEGLIVHIARIKPEGSRESQENYGAMLSLSLIVEACREYVGGKGVENV